MSGLAIHGNHCGPGHGEPHEAAIDPVDQACKEHDAGYARNGYFDKASDDKLKNDLRALLESGTLTHHQAQAATAVLTTFEVLTPVSTVVSGVRDAEPWLDPPIPTLPDGSPDKGSAAWSVNNGQLDPDYKIRHDELDQWEGLADTTSGDKMEFWV